MTEQKVLCGDNIVVLKDFPDNYFSSIVTDCPYGLGAEPNAIEVMKDWVEKGFHEVKNSGGFMNASWDAFVPQPKFWKEAYRVLKPGGHVLAFFGTRTYDWGVMAMRFAGFEIRDQIDFIYGTGFPKSLNIKKAVEKFIKNEQCNCLDRVDGIGLGEDVGCGSWEKVWLQRVACKREKESIRDTIISFKKSGGESTMLLLWKIYSQKTEGYSEVEKTFLLQNLRKFFSKEKRFGYFEIWSRMETDKRIGENEGFVMSSLRENQRDKQEGVAHSSSFALPIWWDEFINELNSSLQQLPQDSGTQDGRITGIDSGRHFDRRLYFIYDANGATDCAKRCSWCGRIDLDQFDGAGSALKPSHEPIVLARKPISEKTVAANVLKRGVGGINIDACRIDGNAKMWDTPKGGIWKTDSYKEATLIDNPKGRFPANLILGCNCETEEHQEGCPVKELDRQSGQLTSGKVNPNGFKGQFKANVYGKFANNMINPETVYGDTGGASRFFYIAKPTQFEKERGLKNFELKDPATVTDFRPTLKSNPENWSNGTETPYLRTTQRKNIHPTVKPVSLLRYLVKMITAKGGICLDPYNGSGTTGIACKMEGINYIGIEQNEYDCEISKSRIAIWSPENIQQQLL